MTTTVSRADNAAIGSSTASSAVTPWTTLSRPRLVLLAVILAVVSLGLWYFVRAIRYEETDDAQVDGDVSNVSPRVSGNVSAVYVIVNQEVREGEVLAEIEPSDLEIAVAQAKALVSAAQSRLEVEDPSVPMIVSSNQRALLSTKSELAGARASWAAGGKDVEQITAQLSQAIASDRTVQLERDRSEKLLTQGAIAQSEFDMRSNSAAASAANINGLRQSLAAARERMAEKQSQIVAIESLLGEIRSNAPRQVATRQAAVVVRRAELDLAKAQLALAERNLTRAKIVAPVAGIVAAKSVALGDHLDLGQQVFAIAQTERLWVTANYLETQLRRLRPGQSAEVHVDALGVDLRGVVQSVGAATGSRLGLLPPENASGNYVKVAQRVPVRIQLNPGQSGIENLRIGMSVEPRVAVR